MTVKVSKPAINVREELADLRKPTGVAGEAMLRAETPQEQFNLIGAGRRNLLINGDFQVWQRGAYTTATNAGNNVYFTDRFKIRNSQSASDMTIQHITDDHPPNVYHGDAVKCVSTTGASTIEHMGLYHIIEDYEKLQGQTVTYSAWVKANTAVQIWIYELGTTNRLGTSENHSGNGQWEKLTVTHTYETNNSISGAYTYITTYGNTTPTNGYHISTQHQLELGKVATPFEYRSYGEELAACQRYYEEVPFGRITGYHTGAVRAGFQWKVNKRATPTVTFSSSVLSTGASVTLSPSGPTTYGMSVNASASTVSSGIQSQISIDAEL